jgi:hypothetical protein
MGESLAAGGAAFGFEFAGSIKGDVKKKYFLFRAGGPAFCIPRNRLCSTI